jgi:hypothetical protein
MPEPSDGALIARNHTALATEESSAMGGDRERQNPMSQRDRTANIIWSMQVNKPNKGERDDD